MSYPNHISDSSKMLVFLKKEEELYKKLLHHMEQEYMRLQIEELALKSAIRQEQIKVDSDEKYFAPSISGEIESQSNNIDPKTSQNDSLWQKGPEYIQNNSSIQNPEADAVCSSITDDRYLDPLILNSNFSEDSQLIEFEE